ncbi:MAG: asparagine synthase-related protein [bacterium]|nr:asparagine synthase-related protein [bacterium]
MWCGVFGHSEVPGLRGELGPVFENVRATGQPAVFESDSALLTSDGLSPDGKPDALSRAWRSEDGRSGLVWTGEWFGAGETAGVTEAQRLWDLWKRKGPDGFADVNGAFTIAAWDGSDGTGVLAGDPLGIMPVYYAALGGGLAFANIPELVLRLAKIRPEPDLRTITKFLTFCYNPGFQTMYRGVRRLRPGDCLVFRDGKAETRPFWRPRFTEPVLRTEAEWAEDVRQRMAEAVRVRVRKNRRTGVFLSGGLDSSSVVSLLSRAEVPGLRTFSFRCRGLSFDESHYAQMVADAFGTRHTLVEYRPEDVLGLERLVELQDEPFCDAGINIATLLLGREAEGQVDDLFTGDGGDELFAGHPVYLADRAAAFLRFVPSWVQKPVFAWGRSLRDSDQKKDLRVKIKRFSASAGFPASLGTQRWRAYYRPDDLAGLILPGRWEDAFRTAPFEDMLAFNREAEGPDGLARSLAADYATVVHFYLSRMGLVRPFGIRPKFPLLDPGLVQACAQMPSRLKIRGAEVKRIEKLAVEPLLPHAIVHRKDKLGHSIPLKNWMRDHAGVRSFMADLLSEETVRRRGLFDPGRVQAMMREHIEKRENHAHRLWALMVLELWLTRHVDRPAASGTGGSA